MKRIAVALATVAVAAVCIGAPAARQAAADPPARGDELAGKFLGVNVRQSTGVSPTLLQNASVKRLGNREFLTGELILTPDIGAEWQGAVAMLPLDQIDSIVAFDDRDKALKVMKDTVAQAAAQAAVAVPPPAAGVAPPPGTVPGGIK
jgi:hypothetical protein